MVSINSWEPGINSEEETLYLRTINEFRIEFENHILFFLNHLRSSKRSKVNSIHLESELEYLDKLCERYHVEKIKLKINSEKENKFIDGVLMLIKRVRKAIDYSFLDVADFYYEDFEYFIDIKLNKNISTILKETLIKYHHKIPKKIKGAPREKSLEDKKFFEKKFYTANQNYVLNEFIKKVSISIDKMFLKVYDYLIESKLNEINSHKLYFLKKDFENLGKKYFKQKYKIKINNVKPKSSQDKCLDEVAANLHRMKEIFIN